jgi:hypothetical protein
MKRACLLAALLALGVAALDARAADAAAERVRIRAERAQAEQRYAAAERECRARFVVTSCVEAAQVQRRDTLTRLRNEELVLDQAERRQRAAERAAGIRDKQSREPAPRAVPRAAAAAQAASEPPARLHLRSHGAPERSHRLSPEAESRNRAAYEAREREAEVRREAIERRNAERQAKSKKPSLPLPLPPTAAGSAATR